MHSGTMALMEKIVPDLAALRGAAEELLASLSRNETATLVTLSGELGAGKTAFTKALASALGITEDVTSPTFVLEKIYSLPEPSLYKRLVHIDAYRLKNGTELAALGFDELMKDGGNLVVLEWPEKVADALPNADRTLTLRANDDGSRTISYA